MKPYHLTGVYSCAIVQGRGEARLDSGHGMSMSRYLLITTAVVCVALVAAPEICRADGDSAFFIESFAGNSVLTGEDEPVPGDSDYSIDLRLPSGMALQSSFNRQEVERSNLIFGTAISEEARAAATLTLGDRTSMSFSREEVSVSDVFLDLLERQTTTTMQFSQGFGAGSSEGSLSLMRSLHVDERGDDPLRTMTQTLGLDTGLGEGMQFTGGFTQRQSEESPTRLQETRYAGELTMALSGGEGRAHYDYLQRLVEGSSTTERRIDLVAPFQVQGGTLHAAHHLHEKIVDDKEHIDRETKFIVPLGLLHDGAQASYLQVTKVRNDKRDEKSELTFMTPLQLFGHAATFEHISTETISNDNVEDQRILRLAADIGGSQAMVERTDTVKPSGDETTLHRRLRIHSPEIDIADYMSFRATHVRQERDGEELSRVSRLIMSLRPLSPLEVATYRTIHETPGQPTRHDHDIRTRLRLAGNARLSGSITEKEQREGSPEIVRHVELQRDRSNDRDVDVRLGYTSFGAQEDEAETGMLAQVSVGDQAVLGMSATYTEYHEKKLEPLGDATTSVEVRAGDPARLGLRAGYSDQAGRPEPERTVGLAMNTLGGALKLDYLRNTLDPRGENVLLSDVYELGFRRSVFGGVAMDLGYRYFVPREDSEFDTDHFFKLRLDGGQASGGGKIALSYLSGHFVPYPRRGAPPASLLDLTYEKRWSDEGRLSVSLTREEPPVLSTSEEESFEAQVKYETRF